MKLRMEIEVIDTSHKMPPDGVPVIVAGGTAMRKTGGEWFTGMEEPLFQRPLQWEPLWWAPIPGDNVSPMIEVNI